MTHQEMAILRSVSYAALFDYPITVEQLHRSLIECEMTPAEILATFDRSRALQRIIEYRDGFFFPAGRVNLVAERRDRESRSRAFLARHRLVLRLICAIPFTRLIALSGSVAHLNLEPEGDLDLFVVTRGPRVWTVTLAVLILTRLMRCRREICANFVIADTHLAVEQQDLFTANQAIHLKPLIGPDALDEFLAANPFIRKFYPNTAPRPRAVAHPFRAALSAPPGLKACATGVKTILEAVLAAPSPLIECASRTLYGWYLRRRAARWRSPEQVRLQSDYLKLHTRSHRESILKRFDLAVDGAIHAATVGALQDAPVRVRSAAR
jgi:hypothetical protein